MEGWMDGRTNGGICRLDEWAGFRSVYRRIPQDTACYSLTHSPYQPDFHRPTNFNMIFS